MAKTDNTTPNGNQNTAPNGNENSVEQDKQNVRKSFQETYGSLRNYLSNLLDIKSETDFVTTTDSILKDISFHGHNAWILIFSIFVASVGLNVSSPAVVIGAMLISPLMGPIVGLGFSVATNDLDTLKRSLVNLGVMVTLSVLTAFTYFKLSPLTELTPELAARTSPNLLDVLVAIFGGFALIIAKTKKGTIATVIMGVAIATALMPPLCTAGYGLAVGEYQDVFFGAMYLFFINTVYIALSTFAVTKMLKFPMVRYANSKLRKNIARIAGIVAFAAMAPSVFLFWLLLQESAFTKSAKDFVEEELKPYQKAYLQDNATEIDYVRDGVSTIEVSFIGEEIPEEVLSLWDSQLKKKPNLKNAKLIVLQNKSKEFNQYVYLKEIKTRDSLELLAKTNEIKLLSRMLDSIRIQDNKKNFPFDKIAKEIRLNYGKVTDVSYAIMLIDKDNKVDTVPTFRVNWNDDITLAEKVDFENRLANWLSYKMELEKIDVDIKPKSITDN